MKRLWIFVLCAALLFFSPLAESADASPNYLTLKAGAYLPQDDDLDEFDNGFNGEIALGHRFTPFLSGELGIGYFSTETGTISFVDPVLGPVSGDIEIVVVPVTFSAKISTDVGSVEPYALIGIGLYFADAEVNASALGVSASESEDDTAFGFHFGLGANVSLSQNMFFGIEGKYLVAQPSFVGEDVNIDGIQVTGNLGFRF